MIPADQAEATGVAFMKRVQADNGCATTGAACRAPLKCGCHLEMEAAIKAETGLAELTKRLGFAQSLRQRDAE